MKSKMLKGDLFGKAEQEIRWGFGGRTGVKPEVTYKLSTRPGSWRALNNFWQWKGTARQSKPEYKHI